MKVSDDEGKSCTEEKLVPPLIFLMSWEEKLWGKFTKNWIFAVEYFWFIFTLSIHNQSQCQV